MLRAAAPALERPERDLLLLSPIATESFADLR